MAYKYKPKLKCECKCSFWDYSDNPTAKCYKCKKIIKKEPHGLEGAEISKNQNGNYVLEFPEFKEEITFSRWEDLQTKLNDIEKNDGL